MNDNAKKWVAALRSGKFKQARDVLRRVTKYDFKRQKSVNLEQPEYCCLGVACKLYEQETGDKVDWSDNTYLPYKVRKWLGLRDDRGGSKSGRLGLAMRNDRGHDFNAIANEIETNPQEYFLV